jgi:lysophospholipase L1-like esterase
MQDIRICFFGESFVNGTGDRTHLGWTGRLCADRSQQGYSITHYNLGIRRETSTQLAQRWEQECDRRFEPKCDNRLVFSFGTNDTTLENAQLRVEQGTSLHNVRQILNLARQKCPVLMISSPGVLDSAQNQRLLNLSEQFAHLCQELSVPYLDVLTPLSQSPAWREEVRAGDGAHPDAGGYTELADIIQNWSAWQNWFVS